MKHASPCSKPQLSQCSETLSRLHAILTRISLGAVFFGGNLSAALLRKLTPKARASLPDPAQ